MVYARPGTYRNIDKKDREFFVKTLSERAKHKTTGSEFTRLDRLQLRRDMYHAYKSGHITKQDYLDFKPLIENI